MGNSLSSYRRGSTVAGGEDSNSALKIKASIRPTTGIGLSSKDDDDIIGKGGLLHSGPNFSSSEPSVLLRNGDGHSGTLMSQSSEGGQFARNQKNLVSMRSSKYSPKVPVPIPSVDELEKRFTKVLASMDLPPDKAKLLKQYDDKRKWEIVCDQELVQVREKPRVYLKKIQTYLDPKASRSFKKRKALGESTSTQVLKDLEISLRTNNIEWVREFLNEENRGLDVLVDYLNFRLVMMRQEQKSQVAISDHERSPVQGEGSALNTLPNGSTSSPSVNKRTSKLMSKLNMGDAKDDIHVCILCLRAIMNTKHGLNMVILKQESINAIALSLRHKSLRTKALVLELLAAVCLVQGGHHIILRAFDNFKEVCSERRRFETLVDYFMNYETFYVEFMVACMQFINIVVHSVDDMNERVYLQYEFMQLGIDIYLEKLKNTQSEELRVQISAYLDNVFDVAALMEDSETKNAALERVAELEEETSHLKEIYQKMESDSMSRMLELEQKLYHTMEERDSLRSRHEEITEEVTTLRRAVKQKEEEIIMRRMSHNVDPEAKVDESDSQKNPYVDVERVMKPSVPAPPVPPPPPPPLFASKGAPGPPPPPPPGMGMGGPGSNVTIKKALQPKCKLPTLNWTVLKPREVKGTVFNQLDDSKYYSTIDFEAFERTFQLSSGSSVKPLDEADNEGSLNTYSSKRFKKPEAISLLEHTRLRNIAISRRKLGDLPVDAVVRAINALDLTVLKVEQVEIIQRMVPTEQETKLYREYINERKNPELLSEEDKFLLHLSRVERISTKLQVMAYIASFKDSVDVLQPQIYAVITASRAVRAATKFHQVLEIILAFGNYLNGAKRGPAYGFKIQSLESLMDTKSVDKRQSLLHYIAETISTRYSNLSDFTSDLQFVDKACAVSLENILSDLADLERGMELTKKESQFLLQKNEQNNVVRDFLSTAEDKLIKLRTESRAASNDFGDCVEFYGEERQQSDTGTFFMAISKFIKNYKAVENENEQRRRLSTRNQSPPETLKAPGKKQQDALINELKRRQVNEGNKKLQEVYHGALEDILSDLKNEPYRRADALRRSQRRKVNNERLSKTFDDFEV